MTEGPILLVGIAILAGLVIVKWLVFTGLLWIAIRIQKMPYNLLGLFGSSLLATLVACIAFVASWPGWCWCCASGKSRARTSFLTVC